MRDGKATKVESDQDTIPSEEIRFDNGEHAERKRDREERTQDKVDRK